MLTTKRIEEYFKSGWEFFIPYLALYLVGWRFNFSISHLTVLFQSLHALNCALLIYVLFYSRTALAVKKLDFVFWVFLALCFYLPGAYTEYPSDPWEHWKRLFSWQTLTVVGENPIRFKMAYFWGWSVLAPWPLELRRLSLDFYSTFWQLLLAYQYFLLVSIWEKRKAWQFLHVLGFFLLFGTNLFNFRYYALSSTPLAYIAYLASLRLFYQGLQTQKIPSFQLGLLFCLIVFNHRQEVIFFWVGLASFLTVWLFQKIPKEPKEYIFKVGFLLFLISFPLGRLFRALFPKFIVDGEVEPRTLFNTIAFWQPHGRFLETLGAYGVLTIFLLPFLARRFPYIVFVSILPFFLINFPPISTLILKYFPSDVPYRLLFLLPQCLPFILLLSLIPVRHSLLLATVLVLLFSYQRDYPFRGKLFFMFYKTPDSLALKPLDETALWIKKNRFPNFPNYWLLTDDLTYAYLSTQFSFPNMEPGLYDRLRPIRFFSRLEKERDFIKYLEILHPCGLLLGDATRLPKHSNHSIVAASSRHWNPIISDYGWHFRIAPIEWSDGLVRDFRWTKTKVPPFYWLYEPDFTEPEWVHCRRNQN